MPGFRFSGPVFRQNAQFQGLIFYMYAICTNSSLDFLHCQIAQKSGLVFDNRHFVRGAPGGPGFPQSAAYIPAIGRCSAPYILDFQRCLSRLIAKLYRCLAALYCGFTKLFFGSSSGYPVIRTNLTKDADGNIISNANKSIILILV